MNDPRAAIREQALAAGFDAVGFAPAAVEPEAREALINFLAEGRQGDMGWLADKADRRGDPKVLWPEARSIVVLGMNYGPDHDPLKALQRRSEAAISVYAQGRDYHDLIKKRLKRVARWMVETLAGEVKVFVDTAPVLEKHLAMHGGLGWQGKHSNLVSRVWGSWLFLGEIYTTLDLQPDQPEADHCGACRRCLDICPTAAFPAPYQLDARRCISYLTIEHKGAIPREFRPAMGNRIYGCDDCLAVCPWNKFAKVHEQSHFDPLARLESSDLGWLAGLDEATFRQVFAGSPIKRTGRDRFLRNVLIAIGNSADPSLVEKVSGLLKDSSPLVRGSAVWALSRLMTAGEFARLRDKVSEEEEDPEVREEWLYGCAPESTGG